MQQFQIMKAGVLKYNRNSIMLIILREVPAECIPLPKGGWLALALELSTVSPRRG